jgi:hypothetical protein
MKGILCLIFGFIALISGTFCLLWSSPILTCVAIIFCFLGMIFGSRGWDKNKQVTALIGVILSIIGLIEALIFVFTHLIH